MIGNPEPLMVKGPEEEDVGGDSAVAAAAADSKNTPDPDEHRSGSVLPIFFCSFRCCFRCSSSFQSSITVRHRDWGPESEPY